MTEAPVRDKQRVSHGVRLIRGLEETATAVLFIAMFVTVIAGVASRYVFDQPLVWTVSISTLAFIAVITIGSGPLHRDDDHIAFDLVYRRLPPAAQFASRIGSDLLIVVPFSLAIWPTVRYLQFMGAERVPGVGVPFSIAFSPFLVFLVATVLHRLVRLFADLRAWRPDSEGVVP
ncbi:TRAP transporter small permease [Phytoactinopolyspora alkaliphila]|uniref:TRAP transporter small permease n=1 Tax=Phytoactinopolyspora alkaliphila TaxID=1783498 RepID=A0A6N9YN77_9ACTN|nr:TRAP transporter small permease [Phytoactinopolyspora alkaliphila]NED96521.1 TRAP transporter small permease [Phytoactinopolyspora alkaliphila]